MNTWRCVIGLSDTAEEIYRYEFSRNSRIKTVSAAAEKAEKVSVFSINFPGKDSGFWFWIRFCFLVCLFVFSFVD